MNTAEILRAAAAEVRRGWMQGDLDDDSGNVCVVGAICRVVGTLDDVALYYRQDEWAARQFVARALSLDGSELWRDPLPEWNDAPGQTAENVATGLEFAALIYEQEHHELAATPAEERSLTCNRS